MTTDEKFDVVYLMMQNNFSNFEPDGFNLFEEVWQAYQLNKIRWSDIQILNGLYTKAKELSPNYKPVITEKMRTSYKDNEN